MEFARSPLPDTEPPRDCPRCPRLARLRDDLRIAHPEWWNAPVPAMGDPDAWLAVVGLAPGKHGANRTGRPFTGDGAGPLLFDTLKAHGLAEGDYAAHANDGIRLTGAIVVNAVRCLPPENKPTPDELRTCRVFAAAQVAALTKARVFVALGAIAHQSAVKILGGKLPKCRFGHLAEHVMPDGRILIDTYHPSRYNQNTGRLTPAMFDAVFARACALGTSLVGNA